MTTPDLSSIVPLKWKTWVAAVSGVLAVVVPYVLEAAVYLPSPWPIVIGGVIALLGAFGVYKTPFVPPGAVVVPETRPVPPETYSPPPVAGEFQNPWK